jgi:hypothetical protein
MYTHLVIALIAALLNAVLASTVPCLLNKYEGPMVTEVKNVYKNNKQVIIASSLIIAVTVYLALSVFDEFKGDLSNLSMLNNNKDISNFHIEDITDSSEGMPVYAYNTNLKNLVRLQ